jgi:exodeoxyribonuclease V alpha subunit
VLPCDTAGVVGWLAAKLPQISRRRAEALVERFGVDGLWALLDAGAVGALCVVDGITLPRADEIVAAYQLHKQDRDRIVRFKQWGLTDNQIARVVDEWGEEAEERILRDPYALIECVKGFGWQRADAVAQRMGVRRDDPSRLAAGLLHAMDTATQSGHCYCPAGKLVALAAQKICSVTDESAVRRALEQLVERGKVDRIGQNIYLPRIAKAEGQLAKTFAARVRQSGKGRAA